MSFWRVDVVVPTLRADVNKLQRVVTLPVPPSLHSLHFYLVVDGTHTDQLLQLRSDRVSVLSTAQGDRDLPAGASAARNTGLAASDAEWVLLLDDDIIPQQDLLYRYAEHLQTWLGSPDEPTQMASRIFGFAGVTDLVGEETSLWSLVVRLSGMTTNFKIAGRHQHPPWSPTANLMIRAQGGIGPGTWRDSGVDSCSSAESHSLLVQGSERRLFDETLPKSGGE